jgi:type IV secretion system protein VirB6
MIYQWIIGNFKMDIGFLPLADVSVGDFFFFRQIISYLRDEIADFGLSMMHNFMQWVGAIALTLMTLWVLVQGFRIVTGRSRDSMAVLVTSMARAALIVSVATSMGMFGRDLHEFLTEDISQEITTLVTGEDKTAEEQIDEGLGWMQVALATIDALQIVGDNGELQSEKARALWFTGIGTGGPAVVAGSMLMLYQVAIALFIGFGPLFILCLLFDQTKQLFQRWLFYGIGTMFSMAVLAAMVSIAMEMIARVAAALWATEGVGALFGQDFNNGITSQAMQQGGMGLILTTLILSAPPMAAMFFQGTLGAFTPYAAMGASNAAGSGSPGPQGQPPGSFTPSAPSRDSGRESTTASSSSFAGRSYQPGSEASGGQVDSGRYAQATYSQGSYGSPAQSGPRNETSGGAMGGLSGGGGGSSSSGGASLAQTDGSRGISPTDGPRK